MMNVLGLRRVRLTKLCCINCMGATHCSVDVVHNCDYLIWNHHFIIFILFVL